MGDPGAEGGDDGEYGGGMPQSNIPDSNGGGPAGLPKKTGEKLILKPFDIKKAFKGPQIKAAALDGNSLAGN
jgi:hypothetical protein